MNYEVEWSKIVKKYNCRWKKEKNFYHLYSEENYTGISYDDKTMMLSINQQIINCSIDEAVVAEILCKQFESLI